MKKKTIKAGILSLFVLVLAIGGFFVFRHFYTKEAVIDREKAVLPSAVAFSQTVTAMPQAQKTTIPNETNWDVPFTSQAPDANWDHTHEEACEEAALLMAKRYFENRPITSAGDAETGLRQIISWENENLGFFESTTAEETTRVAREFLGLNAEVINTPSISEIKAILASGKLVILPEAGREIGNPFYTAPGPLYHMLLLKGYTENQFITNDAGTKRGANYPYDFSTVLDANHDWNGGDVEGGAKEAIVISK